MSGAFVTFSKIGEKEGEPIEIPFARFVGEFDFYTTDMSSYFGMPYILQIKIQQNTCKTCSFWKEGSGILKRKCCCEKIIAGDYITNYEKDELVYSCNGGGCFFTGHEFGCVHHRK